MSNIGQSYNPGLVSISGFAYQIKVFVLLLAALQRGEQIEFETLDDIAIQEIAHSDNVADSCTKRITDANNKATVFQVKQTNVTPAKSRSILYNWLIALNQNRSVSRFEVYVDKGYTVNNEAFCSGAEKEFAILIGSKKKSSALVSIVKSIYEHKKNEFIADYDFVVKEYSIKRIDNIDTELYNAYSDLLHLDAKDVGHIFAEKRLEELLTGVCARIFSQVSRRESYICCREEIMQMCDEICRRIYTGKYEPDYSSFERIHAFSEIDESVQKTRAYKQLQYCNLDSSSTMKHLLWQQYYIMIRNHYLLDAQQSTVDTIEDIAVENHKNVVIELQEEGKDIPRLRLVKTKEQTISNLIEEHSRWGAYVFLTNSTGDKSVSWKDDEDE